MEQLDPYFESESKKYSIGWTDMRKFLHQILNPGHITLLVCRSGCAVLLLKGRKLSFKRGDILHIYDDMFPVFICVSDKFSVFYCISSNDFVYEVTYNTSSLFEDFFLAYPLLRPDEEQAKGIRLWIEQMEWLEHNIASDKLYPFVRDYIYYLYQVIDMEAQKYSDKMELPPMNRAEVLFRKFCILLDKYSCREHNVSFYAEKLCITPYYLSKITDEVVHETPKSMIDKEVILAIKIILTTTDLSVKAIAEQMHFEDTSYLCRYFKRHVGMSLSTYRKENRY